MALAATAAAGLGPLNVVEVVFLFAPLVLIPLCLAVLGATTRPSRIAALLMPVGAGMSVCSLWLEAGKPAAFLAGGWVLVCALLAAAGVLRLFRGEFRSVQGICSNACFLFLLAGSVWFTLHRAGVAPFGYPPTTVFLAAVHFHFSGCVFPAVLGATLGLSPRTAGRKLLSAPAAVAMLAGLALLVAGNVRRAPEIKSAGATLLVAAAFALAVLALSARAHLRTSAARLLLPLSVAALLAGMSLVAVFAVSELLGRTWLGVPEMAMTHGPLNAAGFALCALLAFRFELRGQESGTSGGEAANGSRTAG
ncbi:MAG: YndJ family transporter [Planctomycetes bacterium]|nr:YndJ family transporter [Planctomycetota bacterium]